VNELLAGNATVGIVDRWGNTPLRDAVSVGHTGIAGTLIGKGGELQLDEREASNELCKRARKGDLEGVRLLLSCKVDANAVDDDGRGCLHLAASEGSMHVLRELLTHGADANRSDRWNGTALADAVRHGHRQCAVELRKAGGELAFDEARTSRELNGLARAGDLEGIKLLIECGADAKAADYDRRTVTHLAASLGHSHIVDYLAMRRYVDFSAKDRWGATALDDAVREGYTKLAETMMAYSRVNGIGVSEENLQALTHEAEGEDMGDATNFMAKDEELLNA